MPCQHSRTISILVIFGLAAVFTLGLNSPCPAADKPNIIFIMFDDLGNADLGYRGSDIKTPFEFTGKLEKVIVELK